MKCWEDFPTWRKRFLQFLQSLGLDRHVLEDKCNLGGEAQKEWAKDQEVVEEFLRSAIPGPSVWSALKRMGWDSEAKNPKMTFFKLTDYFTKPRYRPMGTDIFQSAIVKGGLLLHQEFVNIRRANFDRFEDYLTEVNCLRCGLDSTDFKLNEKAYVILALGGISTEYPDLCLKYAYDLKDLKWESLMRELYVVAIREDARREID
jgi:hypothetical protein